MDKSFKTAVAFYKPIVQLTHQQEVMRLYRRYVHGSLVGHRPTSGVERAQGLCLMHQAIFWASMLFSPVILCRFLPTIVLYCSHLPSTTCAHSVFLLILFFRVDLLYSACEL